LAGTGLATRALALQALPDRAATLAGSAALFSGYALFTAYERSAFGEMAGGVLLPLLLLLVLRDGNPGATVFRRALDGSAAWLALVVAAAWLSNAPAGVMACYLLAAVALALAVLRRSWAPVVRAAAGAGVGMALACFYIVPAAAEQRWVAIQQATDDPGLKIENSWLFARHWANPLLELHDRELLRVSLLAVSMVAVALGGLLVALLRGRSRDRMPERRWWLPLALIPVAVLLLQLPISLPVWNLLPRLRFLQFPWRWLAAVEAPMGIFFAMAVRSLWPARHVLQRALVAVCLVVFLAGANAASIFFFQLCDEEDAVAGMLAAYRQGAGFEGVDEYAPPGADSSLLAMDLPAACLTGDPDVVLGQGAEGTAPAWDASQASCRAVFAWKGDNPEHLRLSATLPEAGYLVLRLRAYPAWALRVNGHAATPQTERADGLIAVAAPQGPVELAADWTATDDTLAGRWLSGLGILLLAGLAAIERRQGRRGLS
ncbi:MAG: 6-pyruvoyl-tetrahydropterin synthase-related protein, partial [Terracidiphilus sp.]